MSYVVLYERTPEGWSAYVPDLPGCVAAGDTRSEVERLMREAITLHIESLRDAGEAAPPPDSWTSFVEV
ncbi:MAG: type II toxin-antitoxin system HicB family antitoxin [Dehalococcoidia bacterium]|nr:type II toxin-antitoxin system HicB family antitoxin [Dehalococcoidia bacterium]